MTQQYVEDNDVTVLGGVVARGVAERVACVGLGAERQQLVKTRHLVSQHGEVERRAAQRRRRQVNVALHVVQVLKHSGVALHQHSHAQTPHHGAPSREIYLGVFPVPSVSFHFLFPSLPFLPSCLCFRRLEVAPQIQLRDS